MAAMTNVAIPVSDGGSNIWTLIYTSGGTPTIRVHNRHGATSLLVRVNGSSTAADDAADSPAEILLPGNTMTLTLANGDKVFAKPVSDSLPGRVTVTA